LGTTYILQNGTRRAYALCTGIPFFLVAGTVFTAGVESVVLWWSQASASNLAAGDAFRYRLMSVLASAILVLGAVIVLESVRRWYLLLQRGAAQVIA
jgi:hypothetical protein